MCGHDIDVVKTKFYNSIPPTTVSLEENLFLSGTYTSLVFEVLFQF